MNHDVPPSRRASTSRAPRRRMLLILTGLLAIGTALGASSAAAATNAGNSADAHSPIITTHPVPAGTVSGLAGSAEFAHGDVAIDCFEPKVEDCPEVAN